MRNIKLFAAIIFVLSIFYTLPALAQSESMDANLAEPNVHDGNVVDVNVARIAAAAKLPLFYTGPWTYFDHFVMYDLDGIPAAYAIVFKKSVSDPNISFESVLQKNASEPNWAQMEFKISALRKQISQFSQEIELIAQDNRKSGKKKNQEITAIQKQINIAEAQLLGKDSFATVVTGAKDNMPVILKCHKGLLGVFVKKPDAIELLENEDPNSQWEIDKFLYLGRFNEAIEVSRIRVKDAASHGKPKSEKLVVEMRTRSVWTLDQLRDKERQLERKKEEIQEERSELAAEENARKEHNKKLWNVYRQRFLRDKQSQSIPAEKKEETIEPKEGKKEKQETEESGSVKSLQDTDKTSDRRAGPSNLKPSPDLLEESEAPGEEKSRVKGDRSSNENQR